MKIADRPAGVSPRLPSATPPSHSEGRHNDPESPLGTARHIAATHAARAFDLQGARRRLGTTCIALALLPLALAGCGSLFDEGAAAGAGVVGATVASKLSASAAVTSGIGLGALAAAQSGAKYVEKRAHQRQQDTIATLAGALAPGQVTNWSFDPRIKLEPAQHGRVTVSRVIAAQGLDCKEIVFSVDTVEEHVKTTPVTASSQGRLTSDSDVWTADQDTHQAPRDEVTSTRHPVSAFYVATICRDGTQWKWATAEPATERWGALQ